MTHSRHRLRCAYDELDTGQPCKLVALANTDAGDQKVTVLVASVAVSPPIAPLSSPAVAVPVD